MLIDNYDSFTYNLYDYVAQLGYAVEVKMNDTLLGDEEYIQNYDLLLLSPGPRKPDDAGNLMSIIHLQHQFKPILGICLGHQALGQYFGAHLSKALKPMHGKTSNIQCAEHPVFKGLPNPLTVMRYHSLIISNLADTMQPLAYSTENELMCFEHKQLPIIGFQFHPESVLTSGGLTLLDNTLKYLIP